MTNGREKSDPAIVAAKQANKAGKQVAEPVERRAGPQGERGTGTHAPNAGSGRRATDWTAYGKWQCKERRRHDWLLRFLEHRIGDVRILRLMQKWLRAASWRTGS
jgi:hypothetical protein